jgi:branched-chain amino acid transport system ATP-binding protein
VIAVTIFNPLGIDGAIRRDLGRLRRGSRPERPDFRNTGRPAVSRETKRLAPRISRGDSALLETDHLTVSYGAQRAVDDVSIRIERGATVGLVGPNGAGKTSLIDALTGFVPYTGDVYFEGKLLEGSPHRRCRQGLARTWQSVELFIDLSVREHLLLAADVSSTSEILRDLVLPVRRGRWDELRWIVELVGLEDIVDARPKELPISEQKRVGIARAIASGARLVLLDEPAAGLDRDESRGLADRFRVLTEHGIGILVIDHDVDLLLDVCDHAYVLDFGKLVASGTPGEIRSDDHLMIAYVGQQLR